MARGPRLTTRVLECIAEVYTEHRDWQARQVHLEVNKRLGQRGPGLSAVQKQLAKIRRQDKLEPDPQDQPWSMATLGDHPIPPEALPAVLRVFRLQNDYGFDFTIRHAKWVARLSGILPDTRLLSTHAMRYAVGEEVARLMNRPYDSTYPDEILLKYIETGEYDYGPPLSPQEFVMKIRKKVQENYDREGSMKQEGSPQA